jgi:hypothetical protein
MFYSSQVFHFSQSIIRQSVGRRPQFWQIAGELAGHFFRCGSAFIAAAANNEMK